MTKPLPPSDAESKVIRWFFGIGFSVAIVFIPWKWFAQVRQCTAICIKSGHESGSVHLNSGSRINIGSHCVCEK